MITFRTRATRTDRALGQVPVTRWAQGRRTVWIAAALLVVTGCTTDGSEGGDGQDVAPAVEAPAPAGPDTDAGAPESVPAVRTAPGPLGTHLVDADGMALYLFTADGPGVSTCADACLATWPALTVEGAPDAGRGVDAALLGTLTREDGSEQITYAGWPLYRFAGDTRLGDIAGQGLDDAWFLVAPDGEAITATEAEQPMSGYGY
jgi:predicted lipoprotein with Yx(FWY)xxD motif